MKIINVISFLFALVVSAMAISSCGKQTAASSATGYPEVSVKCGSEACVK
jgi:hypothetical protein